MSILNSGVTQQLSKKDSKEAADIYWTRYLPYIVLVVVFAAVSIFVPYFLTISNLLSVLLQTASLAILAIGQAAVLILGGIDLSMPGVMALGSIFGAMYMRAGGNPVLGAVIMLLVPAALGLINGISVSYFGMIPFVVTLAMQAITIGAATMITNQISIPVPENFCNAILTKIGGIPLPIIIVLILTLFLQFAVTKTYYGRWLYSTGTNMRTSRVSGVPTKKVVLAAYSFAGLMGGLAAIIMTSRLYAASPQMGKDAVAMDIIASAAVGGVSTMGGVGTAVNAVIGAIIITLISNVMNMANVSYYLTLVIKGIIIITFVAIDANSRKKSTK
jgi:ribose/xylose/arabinose/galactoside ABC-type transport system permease subunit